MVFPAFRGRENLPHPRQLNDVAFPSVLKSTQPCHLCIAHLLRASDRIHDSSPVVCLFDSIEITLSHSVCEWTADVSQLSCLEYSLLLQVPFDKHHDVSTGI